MNLHEKLLDPAHPVYLYGTTPPREGAAPDDITAAVDKLIGRIGSLDLDGIVVYDVQDESERTQEPRPFPFLPTIDSRVYSQLLQQQTGKEVITYKCTGALGAEAWNLWLQQTADFYGLGTISLVGRASSRSGAPQDALGLSAATQQAANHPGSFFVGGVAIAERHSAERSESQKMLKKTQDGCRYFISQAVYQPDKTIAMLKDYVRDCQEASVAPSRVILTFAPCGHAKTMAFIKWLGVAIPAETEAAILKAENPLEHSLQVCQETLRRIIEVDYGTDLRLGLNIESVSIRKDEIDASIELFHRLKGELEAG